jgi:cell division protein FtsA
LEVESIIITADSQMVDQLVEAVHGSGYKVSIMDFFPSTLAAGEEILNQVQQRLGTVLVDIGGSCTCILIYNHGYPVGFDVLPVGSDHITGDLAVCLRTTLAGAEEVKVNLGLGPERSPGAGSEQGGPGVVTIPRLSGSGFNEVPVKTAVEIIEARICEILDMIRSSVGKLAGGLDLPGGLVLAGGGSRLRGLDLFARDHLGVKVSFGSTGMEGEKESRPDVNMAAAVGLLKYILNYRHQVGAGHQPPPGLWSRVKDFFKVTR